MNQDEDPRADDDLVFQDEADGVSVSDEATPWSVLVVDDAPDVHQVTRLAVAGLTVDGVAIRLSHASSAAEARVWLSGNPDVAVVLLDVVMESEHAGLELARWIRESLGNALVRVVLRTGQPGTAPETKVVSGYDIHDYLAKTELTRTRLHTALTGAVRAYRDMRTIAEQRTGLRKVIDATASLFPPSEAVSLLGRILRQVSSLLLPRESTVFFVPGPGTPAAEARVLAASGRFADAVGQRVRDVVPSAAVEDLERTLATGVDVPTSGGCIYAVRLPQGDTGALYVDGGGTLNEWDRTLVSLYVGNAGLALANAHLWADRDELLTAFARFVERALVGLLGHEDVRAVTRGDHVTRELTVLFLDVVGFTRRTERSTPAEIFGLLNEVFGTVGPALARHGGIVDKYLGDGAMVLFPGGGAAAVAATCEMFEALDALNASGKLAGPPVEIGVSIHAGPVILGTIGYQSRIDITAVSDAVNIAARMQGWTRGLGARALLSEAVASQLSAEGRDALRHFGPLPMRGREALVPIYQLIPVEAPDRRPCIRETRPAFERAVALRTAGSLRDASAAFAVVAAQDPEDVAAAWLAARCRSEAGAGPG